MSATGSVPQRGVRHSIAMVTKAKTLREGGWSYGAIARLLEQETGTRVSSSTVRLWTDPKAAAAQREHQRDWSRRRAQESSGSIGRALWAATDDFKFARIKALDGLGLSPTAIAKVMVFDFGDPISRYQVEYALRTGRYPKRAARKAAA